MVDRRLTIRPGEDVILEAPEGSPYILVVINTRTQETTTLDFPAEAMPLLITTNAPPPKDKKYFPRWNR